MSEQNDDQAFGNAVVVTVTFRGPHRASWAELLEKYAKRLDRTCGIFTEQVVVEERCS